MKTILATLVVGSLAATTGAFAQDTSATDGAARDGMRQQLRQEIRAGGVDAARFSELSREQAEARFADMDTNGDGQVSREEFLAATQERADARFARLDRNDDGRLTREDRRSGGKRGEHRGQEPTATPPAVQGEAPAN